MAKPRFRSPVYVLFFSLYGSVCLILYVCGEGPGVGISRAVVQRPGGPTCDSQTDSQTSGSVQRPKDVVVLGGSVCTAGDTQG